MSFFNKIFGSDEPQKSSPSFWNAIESEEDLQKAIDQSFEKKVVVFKHSTRCHISKMVLKNFENEIAGAENDAVYYFLDLISYRPISNKMAEDLGVTHQSPQMIVLENGKAVKNASHQSISVNLI